MANRIHKKEEFSDIDWNYVEKKDKAGCVNFGRGGMGLSDDIWHMYIVEELDDGDINVDYYVLPDYLQYMIETIQHWGRDEVIHEMRLHLGKICNLLNIKNSI